MLVRNVLCFMLATAAVAGCESGSRDGAAPRATAAEGSAASSAASSATSSAGAAPATQVGSLTRIEDVSQVCMVNDQFMGKAQKTEPLQVPFGNPAQALTPTDTRQS